MKNKCQTCAYRGSIPGNAHIKCTFAFSKSEHEFPSGNPHGVRNGWYEFPICFDPVWMIEECQAYSEELDKSMVGDPFGEVILKIN